jgi:hypothetical protein
MLGGGDGQQQQLIRSDKAKSGYKGVHAQDGRYRTKCNTPPCHLNYLGSFDTPEDAAQSYLQHFQKKHPEELKKERLPRPVLLPVQEHLLIRSDKTKTGYKGVIVNKGRYQAQCNTAPCHNNHLGSFDTPEEAAQAYLQHYQKQHREELEQERVKKEQERVTRMKKEQERVKKAAAESHTVKQASKQPATPPSSRLRIDNLDSDLTEDERPAKRPANIPICSKFY